jgi:hypothetical protein
VVNGAHARGSSADAELERRVTIYADVEADRIEAGQTTSREDRRASRRARCR